MPAGHPFQGSQPKHLDEHNNSREQISLPRRPFLSKTSAKSLLLMTEENFDTDKMMRYDDFTDEDVGNIIMDAEPLPPVLPEKRLEKSPDLIELAKEVNSYPGIEEFDESSQNRQAHRTPYQTANNRPVYVRSPANFRQQQRNQQRLGKYLLQLCNENVFNFICIKIRKHF